MVKNWVDYFGQSNFFYIFANMVKEVKAYLTTDGSILELAIAESAV